MKKEIWKPLFNPNYLCSSEGKIKTAERMVIGKSGILVPFTKPNREIGFIKRTVKPKVAIGIKENRRVYDVEYLIYTTFIGEVPPEWFIIHRDKNKYNNNIDNIFIQNLYDLHGIKKEDCAVIEEFPNYIINKEGKVINRKTGTAVKAIRHILYNHPEVRLWKENTTRLLKVHRLLAIAFIPNPENKREVNHIDGNRMNHSLKNLEWNTRSENQKHAYNNGLSGGHFEKGAKHRFRKLSLEDIYEIRGRRAAGEKVRLIAPDYNIGVGQVYGVCTKRQTIED